MIVPGVDSNFPPRPPRGSICPEAGTSADSRRPRFPAVRSPSGVAVDLSRKTRSIRIRQNPRVPHRRIRTFDVPQNVPATTTKLIIGCGYLGAHVAERWLAAGHEVWGVTRS